MKITKAFIASFIFIFILASVYTIHVKFFRVDVIFYSAIFDGIIATLIMALIIYLNKFFSIFNLFEKFQMLIISLFMSYIFAISIPTVIDRSLSFYILEKLNQRGGSIMFSAFENIFKEEYLKEHRLVDIRLTEQKKSGTILIENDCVKLTEKGRKFVKFSLFFRNNFLPKERLIMGVYSDDLTNLFKNSFTEFNYKC